MEAPSTGATSCQPVRQLAERVLGAPVTPKVLCKSLKTKKSTFIRGGDPKCWGIHGGERKARFPFSSTSAHSTENSEERDLGVPG